MNDATGYGSTRARAQGTLRRKVEGGECDEEKTGIATLPTQWMQAVQRGKTSNRRIGQAEESLMLDFGGFWFFLVSVEFNILFLKNNFAIFLVVS